MATNPIRRGAQCASLILLTAVLSASCGPSQPKVDESNAEVMASEILPSIRIDWATDSTQSIENLRWGQVVLADGSLVIDLSQDSTFALAKVHENGTSQPFGVRGSGPGEVRGAVPLGASDSAIEVFDLMQLRFLRFQEDGTVEAVSLESPFFPRAQAVLEGRHKLLGVVPGQTGSLPAVMDVQTGRLDKLLSAPDSFASSTFGPSEGRPKSATVGLWSNGFLMGDGATYVLGLYDWDGNLVRILRREIPDIVRTNSRIERDLAGLRGRSADQLAHARVSLESSPLPHFSHTASTGLDRENRIWVLGPAGDSAYADVFSNRNFLGRIAIPCLDFENAWSMNSRWLALVCTDPTSAEGAPHIVVYEVIEPES